VLNAPFHTNQTSREGIFRQWNIPAGAAALRPVLSSLLPAGNRLESTERYPGIEVDDALEISEQTET
jgi:hypothetical protein